MMLQPEGQLQKPFQKGKHKAKIPNKYILVRDSQGIHKRAQPILLKC